MAFRGWHVLGASFITAMLMAGATFYSFQHFVTPIEAEFGLKRDQVNLCLLYTSPSPRDATLSRMPSSA